MASRKPIELTPAGQRLAQLPADDREAALEHLEVLHDAIDAQFGQLAQALNTMVRVVEHINRNDTVAALAEFRAFTDKLECVFDVRDYGDRGSMS